MKKIIYSVAAMALAFFSASCQQENLEPIGGNTVTYTVQVPGALSTRSAEGFVLTYEVYRERQVGEPTAAPIYQGTKQFENDKVELSLEFVKNQKFVVLFWAQKENATASYNIEDLRNVSLKTLTANDVNAEVFSGIDQVDNCVSAKGGNVELIRPIAQLNIATLEDGLTIGNTTSYTTVNPQTFDMTVNGLWTSYNVATGDVKGSAGNITFDESLVSGGEFKTDYVLMGANYIGFIPQNGSNVTVNFNIHTEEDGTINHIVSNVPVRPNYRTNILGNLVSASDNYIVTLDEEWGDAGKDMEVLAEGLIKNINGDYEITSEVGLAYAINNFFAQGGDFYLTEEIYNLSGYAVNPPAVPAGVTLNIYGETPVVTRAALSGVVITGLDFGALIDEVAESASVSFANITLESNVPFVNKNNGAVAFTDCANSNSNSNDESISGLIAEGDGYVVDMTSIKDMSSLLEALGSGVKTINLSTSIKNTEEVVLDLNGATITGVDNNTSGNFYLINNIGKLTIKNTADKAATITLEAKNNRNWNSSSVVVANNPGGDLTIESGVVIEHLGGTDMAYGIDNLTNGKGTSAVTTINGATIKSTYTSARQFLNGVEATNELIVKGGSKLESTNRAIFFQDPSANPNTGKLVVEEGAELYGDVRLSVTAGSTEWPVIVSVAASALKDGEVTYQNVPDGYAVANVNGTWKVISDVAEVNGQVYTTLADAVDAAEDGSTITFLKDIEQVDGVLITDKNLTIDLNDKTFTVSDGANTNNRNFKINGSSVVTIKNGTMVAEGQLTSGAYGTVRTEDDAVVNLDNVKLYSYRGYGLNVKAYPGTTININNSEIYSQYSGGVEAAGGTIELTNVKIEQKGIYSGAAWCSVAIGVNGGGKVTINSGEYYAAAIASDNNAAQGTWVAYVMSSGGTLDIKGGTFNGVVAEKASASNACGIICADRAAVVNIYDGTFNSNGAILDMRNNVGTQPNPVATLYGGNYSSDPRVSGLYSSNLIKVVEGKTAVQGTDGRWTLIDAVTTEASLKAAFEQGGDIVLGADITVSETLILAEGKTVVLNLNGQKLSAADKNVVKNNGGNLTIKNGTVTRTGEEVGYSVNNASGEITVENATIKRGLYTSGSKMTATNANISHEQSSRHAIYAWNCEVTINSGTFHNDNAGNATLMASGSSIVTINGGTFSIADGRSSLGWTSSMVDQNSTAQVTVKDGLFNGGFRINSADTRLTIEGGEFNTNNGSAFTDSSGTKVVKGGKFTDAGAQNWAKKYIAEGYEMNANGEVVAK